MPDDASSKRDWLPIWVGIACFAVSLLWLFLQLRVWQEEGHDHMLTAINIGVTLVLWVLLLYANYVHWRRLKQRGTSREIREEAFEQLTEDIEKQVQDSYYAGRQAGLILYFGVESEILVRELESVAHHWDYAGEKLVKPCGANEWREWSVEKCFPLTKEKDAFSSRLRNHLALLKGILPGFKSVLTDRSDYTEQEYHQLWRNLQDHSTDLRDLARKIGNSGTSMEGLDETEQ